MNPKENSLVSNLETQQTTQSDEKLVAWKLIDGAILDTMQEDSERNILTAIETDKLDDYVTKITNLAKRRRSKAPGGSAEEIVNASVLDEQCKNKDRIVKALISETLTRKNLEKKLETMIYRSFDVEINSTEIRKLDNTEIKKYLSSKKQLTRWIEKITGNAPQDTSIAQLAKNIGIASDKIEASESLTQGYQNYLKTGYIDQAVIEELMDDNPRLTLDEKKKLLRYFLPTISLRTLIQYGVIEKGDISNLAKTTIDSILTEAEIDTNKLSEEAKSIIKNYTENAYELEIDTDTLDESSIERLLQSDGKKLIAKSIQDSMESIREKNPERVIESFEELQEKVRGLDITGAKDFGIGAYIVSERSNGDKLTWKVEPSELENPADGITLSYYNQDGDKVTTLSRDFDEFLANIQKENSLGNVIISNEAPEYGVKRPFENFPEFLEWIDSTVDSKNRGKGWENGLSFIIDIENQKEYCRITNLDETNGRFDMVDMYGGTVASGVSIEQFYDFLSTDAEHFGLERTGRLDTLENFAKNSAIAGLIYDHGKLQIEDTSHNHGGHGDHGHGDHEHSEGHGGHHAALIPVWGFENKDGNYIKTVFDDDMVTIFEYQNHIEKDKNDKKVRNTKVLEYRPMTLEGLKFFLTEHELTTPIAHDPLTTEKGEIHDAVHPHFHKQGLLGILMAQKSFADYAKAMSMGIHMLEHMLEEQNKAQAAEALYGFFNKTLGKDHALTMHALMEFAGDISKLIDDKITHIKKLGGAPRRKEIRHILLTRPARPHDILAALIVTADMAGHLYPDSYLQDLQGGRYLWFEGICASLGFDYKSELRACQDKEAQSNKETKDHLNEAILIERLFKRHQDDNHPYIQAIAGGSKYWGALRNGRESQVSKGEKEVKERLGAMDRAEYVVSKMESNEPEIAAGGFPGVYNKDPSAINLGPAFAWALSNYPNTTHPDISNNFKNMMDGNGIAFHALPFCRNPALSRIYKSLIPIAIESSGDANMIADWKMVESAKNERVGEYIFNKDHISALWKFWKAHHKKLHPILQMTNPKLQLLLRDPTISEVNRSIVKTYIEKLGVTVSEGVLNDTRPNEVILKMGGNRYDGGSMIIDIDANGDKSLNRILNYIHIDGHSGAMSNSIDRDHLWGGQIMPYLQSIKNEETFGTNKSYQKEHFRKIHDEIMGELRQSISGVSPERYKEALKSQKYLQDLDRLGFDVSRENVLQEVPFGKTVDFGSERAFERFMSGTSHAGYIQANTKKAANHAIYELGELPQAA